MSEIAKKLRCLINQILNVSFNPDFHQQVRQAGIETEGKNLTVHTLRKGYLLNWRCITTLKQPTIFIAQLTKGILKTQLNLMMNYL